MTTYSLFSATDSTALFADFLRQFEGWVTYRAGNTASGRERGNRPLRDESADVYRDMWCSFADYCVPRCLTLANIAADDIDLFLALRGIGDAHRAPRVTTHSERPSFVALRTALSRIDRLDNAVVCKTNEHNG